MLEKLQSDLKASMKAHESLKTAVLRSAIAAYRNEAIAKELGPQGTLSEAETVTVLKRLVKSREDSVEQFTKAGYSDRADQERAEIEILKVYLPAMLEGEALENAVKSAIAEVCAETKRDLGKVMKAMQATHGGNYDGKTASQIIQNILP